MRSCNLYEKLRKAPARSAARLLCATECLAGEPAGGAEIVALKTICGFNDGHAKQLTEVVAFQCGRLPQRFLQMNEQQIELSIARHGYLYLLRSPLARIVISSENERIRSSGSLTFVRGSLCQITGTSLILKPCRWAINMASESKPQP